MKNVVLGVTGGIAAYKAIELVSRLRKLNINVDVAMTASAQEFVTPLTFQSMSQNPVITHMFD
jgi:phosphopantothenoylcysteine decarboxylase/phosphopantothenate--cysteine ligase